MRLAWSGMTERRPAEYPGNYQLLAVSDDQCRPYASRLSNNLALTPMRRVRLAYAFGQ